ncbi:MAG: energy transducer TonB [Chitinophagaceae bacterium]|nr:energy transducer TonB [Oligoflexus sp.]
MKYLLSGIVGFFLTLVVSLGFQHVMKGKEGRVTLVPTTSSPSSHMSAAASPPVKGEMDISVQPIVRIVEKKDEPRIKFMPQYPLAAASDHVEGFVTLTFSVAPDGSVQNLKVIESSPPQVFAEAALTAVSKWTFANAQSKNRPTQDQQRIRLNFSLGRNVASDRRMTDSGI